VPATRRVRGNQPIQLPRDGAILVLAVRGRDGELLDREAFRAGPDPDAARHGPRPPGRLPRGRREPGPRSEGNGQRDPRSPAHRERVVDFIGRGEKEGARVALDGRPIRVSGYDGYFVGPTILDDVRPDMRVAREEIFGPVASVVSVDAFDDAVDLINASPYGNAATIYTTNGKHARDFRYRVRAGN